MNGTNSQTHPRPINDSNVALNQRAASTALQSILSPFEARAEKAFLAFRDKPLLRPFCNIFERNLKVVLDQQSYVWGDALRINTRLMQAIESSAFIEDQKNHGVFWLLLFHTSYFALGYQNRLIHLTEEQQALNHLAFTQATLQQLSALDVKQPDNAPFWEENGYRFHPPMSLQMGVTPEEDVLEALANQTVTQENLTRTPLLQTTDLKAAQGSLSTYQAQTYETFAREMLNDWVAEFAKSNNFGDQGINGIRLLYFKAKPPRDASEAIMDCLRSKYPVSDDLALYNNKKLANDYYAPRKADPIEDKTGHIELFIDCSGSISAGDIGDCLKVFTDFFAKRKKKMTYAINCFDTAILSRIEVAEGDEPAEKLRQLAILGGGGTDFRCTAAKIQELIDAGAPHPIGSGPYKCDLAVVFTDLAGTFPETTPCDFVWVTTTKDCNLGALTSVPVPGTVIYL